jgi:hypothetical protein
MDKLQGRGTVYQIYDALRWQTLDLLSESGNISLFLRCSVFTRPIKTNNDWEVRRRSRLYRELERRVHQGNVISARYHAHLLLSAQLHC